eukprot:COSAG01_NODE_1622_length_9712_cov_40.535005_6_plen_90_part_00
MSSRGRFPLVILDNPLLVSRLSLCSIFLYAWNLVQYVIYNDTVQKDLTLLSKGLENLAVNHPKHQFGIGRQVTLGFQSINAVELWRVRA